MGEALSAIPIFLLFPKSSALLSSYCDKSSIFLQWPFDFFKSSTVLKGLDNIEICNMKYAPYAELILAQMRTSRGMKFQLQRCFLEYAKIVKII